MHPRPRLDGAQRCPVLIGRDDLLTLADRRLNGVRSGSGHMLFLAGEAGIGKTRLLAETCRLACAQNVAIIEVRAYPRDLEVAGGVLSDLAAALGREPTTAELGSRMAQRLGAVPGRGGDASRQRRLLVTDLAELIISLSGAGAVLLALEDLHWADDLTLDVLDRVAGRLASVPLLVVGTYRNDELYPRVPMRTWRTRLLTQRLAEEVRLARLRPDQTAAMAAAITHAVLPVAVTAALHRRSDGIPLHVEEFLAFLTASDTSSGSVPDTLADAVLARAEVLSKPARALGEAASVIGRSFDVDLLAAVTGAKPESIDRALRELDKRFFVQPRGDGTVYDFRHALIRDALYADLPPHRRRVLHARVASAAANAGFGDALISDHYERARQPDLAYRHALAAAAAAAAVSAHREAAELYQRGRRTLPADTPVHERAELLADLAAALAAIDDNAAAAAAYAESYEIRRRLGDDVAAAALVPAWVASRHLLGAGIDERDAVLKEALALVDSAGDECRHARARILAALCAAYMLDRCLDDSIALGREAKSLASALGDVASSLNTDATLGAALVFGGRMDEGWQMLETTIRHARDERLEAESARAYRVIGSCASVLVEYDRGQHWLREGVAYAARVERFNDVHYMTAHLAHTLWATGEWPAARRVAEQALADGRDGITTRITALHVLGYLALGRGDWAAADEHLREALGLGEQVAELQRLSPAMWGLAENALHSGRVADAVAWCERGYAASYPAWDAAYLFPYVVTGVRGYLALDDPTGARDWLVRCETFLRYRSIPGTLPALDHARGLLHLAHGHPGRAREALSTASAAWDSRRRFWEGVQALLDRAAAARRSRRPAEAAALIGEASRRATSTGATTLLSGSRDGHAPDTDHPLTAREIEVARLIATGATNRQIGEALSIAPKTVAAHVEHILTKLGVARRAEVAAWATAHAAKSPSRASPG